MHKPLRIHVAYASGNDKAAAPQLTQQASSTKTMDAVRSTAVHIQTTLMLGLHYVPDSHGSHGRQKRSSPWCF